MYRRIIRAHHFNSGRCLGNQKTARHQQEWMVAINVSYFWLIIPLIILLVWAAKAGEQELNKYGSDPLYDTISNNH